MTQSIITVSQLTHYLKNLISSDMVLSGVILRGEVTNFKEYAMGGTWYFSLKDETSQIKCVVFANVAPKIKFRPHDGMMVVARGKVGVFEKRGEYNLQVFFMEPEGVGAEALAFEQLKQRLAEEGLFAEERKRPLPPYPQTIGVVTSPSGAAVHDIITVVKRRDPSVQLIVIPAIVQGLEGPDSVAKAIFQGNAYPGIDVLIMARGGGSKEELAVFNDERVVRAIASSKLPLVSAVGHEVDITLSDLAADKRAPTPSAAAEMVVPDKNVFKDKVNYLLETLNRSLVEQVQELRQRIEDAVHQLGEELKYDLERQKDRLTHAVERLNLLNPLLVLKRGYSLTLMQGKVVTSVAQVKKGDVLETRLTDGTIISKVERNEKQETRKA